MPRKPINGVGINDADYSIENRVNGKRVECLFYRRWRNLINRCYNPNSIKRNPTYSGCSVVPEWLYFTKFKMWMERQDWQGKELDKDIIFAGNKVYGPDSCAFIDRLTNTFTIDSGASRGAYMIGVHFADNVGKFRSSCQNPFTKKQEALGCFLTEIEAHLTWKKRKHELACRLADMQTDARVANALRVRYL